MIYLIIIILIAAQIYILYKTWQKTQQLSNLIQDNQNGSAFKRQEFYIPKKLFGKITYEEITANVKEYNSPKNSYETYYTETYDETTGEMVRIPHKRLVCRADDKESINLIDINADNIVAKQIEKSINNYLLRNKGAASDYSLIKDIVERYCTSEEEEIETQTPWPLYFGLMGTMLGIIFGIGNIAIFVGFETFVNEPTVYMGQLMGDIAVAMIVSFLGILGTTYLSWASKNAKTILESKKNGFYTWFQTELMPIITKENASEGIQRLEENLSRFNNSFTQNINDLDKTFENVQATSRDQAMLLQTLQKMDLKKMSEANITILSRFNETIGELEKFNDYIDYAQRFLKDNDTRNAAIKQSAVSLDNNLNEVYSKLNESIAKQVDALRESLMQSEVEIEKLVASEKTLISNEGDKIENFNKTMEALTPVINGLNDWKKEFQRQNSELSRLSQAINTIPSIMGSMNNGSHGGSQKIVVEQKSNIWTLVGALVAIVLLLAVLGTNLYYTMSLSDGIKNLNTTVNDFVPVQDSLSVEYSDSINTNNIHAVNTEQKQETTPQKSINNQSSVNDKIKQGVKQ